MERLATGLVYPPEKLKQDQCMTHHIIDFIKILYENLYNFLRTLFMKYIILFLLYFFSSVHFGYSEISIKQNNKSNVESIKVTGSRIRQIDFESFNPMTVWTREDLDNSGYFSVSEFLKNTSLSNFGKILVHNRSTLTLVNGTRLVHDEAVDFISPSSIERVEILRGGSSALYGSDVVGGVINIITKKDFDTPVVSLKVAPTIAYKGGNQTSASVVFGKQFNKGHFLSTWRFRYGDSIKASDRKQWYNNLLLPYSPYPSFIIDKNNIIVDLNCPEDRQMKLVSRVIGCNHNHLLYKYLSSPIYSFSGYNYAEYKMSEYNLYTQWMGFFKSFGEFRRPIIGGIKLAKGHKMSVGSGSAGTLKFFFEDFYKDVVHSHVFLDGLVGIRGYLSKTWDFDWNLKWSNLWKKRVHKNYPYLKELKNALFSGLYDPFDSSKRNLSGVSFYDSVFKDDDMRLFTSLDFSGETGWWDIDLAVGLQAYYNRYSNKADPKVKREEIYVLKAVETGASERAVSAAYAEGIKKFSDLLKVQAAGRIDYYSDFGLTFNPKLAVSFKPAPHFLIRSSAGTSFEAPPLSALNKPTTTGYVSIYDTVACYNELKSNKHFEEIYNMEEENFKTKEIKDKLIRDFLIDQSEVKNRKLSKDLKAAFSKLADQLGKQNHCKKRLIEGITKGNKSLKEIKALTASLGFHWQTHEDHSLTVNGWFNSLSGRPARAFAKSTLDAELRYGKQYVEQHNIQYERDEKDPFNSIKEGTPVDTSFNIAGKTLSGIDAKWESNFSNWRFAKGNFYFKDDLACIIKDKTEKFPGMDATSDVGEFGLPKWRNFATFGWKNSKHNVSLVLKSIPGVKKKNKEAETLPSSHILDLFYQYNRDEKTTLRFGWYNAFFSDPVIDDSIKSGAKFDKNFFDVRGSYFFAELRRAL